jgi:hypothetical protein
MAREPRWRLVLKFASGGRIMNGSLIFVWINVWVRDRVAAW